MKSAWAGCACWMLLGCSGAGSSSETGSTSSSSSSSSSGGMMATLPALQNTTVMEDINADPDVVEVNLTASVTTHVYEDGRETNVYAYNGLVPGPTLQARVGNRIIVHFENQLPEPTTIHWHGLRISDQMDGNPDVMAPVESGGTFTYDFVVPDAGTFWYHPHVNTPEQIEKGLMGSIVVHEATPLQFDAERLFFTDDIRLDSRGQVAPFQHSGGDILHGRGAGLLLLNGLAAPSDVMVRPGAHERWRFFNGSNSRTMSLSIDGASFAVVGVDGGLLSEPFVTARLELTIGQRLDVDVVFDGAPGSVVTLISHVLALNAQNEIVEEEIALQNFPMTQDAPMEYTNVTYPTVAPYDLPPNLAPEKTLELSGVNVGGVVQFTINGHTYPDVEMWEVELHTTTRVKITNMLGMEHPFHMHGQFFHVIAPIAAVRTNPGARDTVLIPGGGNATIEVEWSNPGHWMYHCHIPEHSENGMMGHVMVHSP